jgi:hypothetical protein
MIDISTTPDIETMTARPKVVGRRLKPNMTGLVGRQRWWAPQTYKLEEATAWLRVQLANGMRPCAKILDEAKASNIVYMTLKRAKKAAKIKSERMGKWFWSLPEQEIK